MALKRSLDGAALLRNPGDATQYPYSASLHTGYTGKGSGGGAKRILSSAQDGFCCQSVNKATWRDPLRPNQIVVDILA